MPATGFFEWQVLADGKTKQPYYITLNGQDIFGFAALWDSSKRDDGVTVESCTIVTMPANALMTVIHNVKHRMPAILTKEDRHAWLTTTPDDALTLLKQYPDTHMVATPVSKRVNTPKNNDAELTHPPGLPEQSTEPESGFAVTSRVDKTSRHHSRRCCSRD